MGYTARQIREIKIAVLRGYKEIVTAPLPQNPRIAARRVRRSILHAIDALPVRKSFWQRLWRAK
jgi:hypothetical protein